MRPALALVATLVLALALGAATVAGAATPRPDGHDRALVKQLGDKLSAFQAIGSGNDTLKTSLTSCAVLKKDPSLAFAAVFALLPAVLIDAVNRFRDEFTDLRRTLAGMRPHSSLFRRWLTAEVQTLSFILRFDNHGKKIDYCEAAEVMLDKKSTAKDIRNVLGIDLDPALLAKLFQNSSSATVKRLNPQMRVFFVAAGLSPKEAKALTK